MKQLFENRKNNIFIIVLSAIALWYFLYFFGYQLGKFYHQITH